MKNLLVLTTAGRLHFLHDAIATLRDSIDVLVVDDATPFKVGIKAFCEQYKLNFITKDYAQGLTHSWNLAYRYFCDNNYDVCILSNDDVRFPKGFSRGLVNGIQKFSLVCPISNKPTKNIKHYRDQWLSRYVDIATIGKNDDVVQQFLRTKYKRNPYKKTFHFNGFCFAFGKGISQFNVSKDILFNGRINTRNENLLNKRIVTRGGSMAVCLTSYVFHWKHGTYDELGLKHSNKLWTSSAHPIGE